MKPADLLFLALLVAAFWFLIIRPMKARQRQYADLRTLQNSLQPGAAVMLTSGIHGTVADVGEDTIDLQIAPGTVITVAKGAVAEIVSAAAGNGEDTA